MAVDARPSGSGFSDIDSVDDPTKYVRRLDDTAASAFWRMIKRRTFELLEVGAGDRLLDIGCGAGDDVRRLAEAVGENGRAVGVDRSIAMIAEARRRADGTNLPLAFHVGDAQRLDFAADSFDGCRAERVLQHLDRPEQALSEMVRVVRPGGRVVVVEPDHGATVILGADREVTRRILRWRCEHFRSGRVGGRLHAMYMACDLTDIVTTVINPVGADFTGDSARLSAWARRAAAAKAVTPGEAELWLRSLQEAAQAGRYRQAGPIFLVSGRKP